MLECMEEEEYEPLQVAEQLIKEYLEKYGMGKDWSEFL